MSEPVLAVANFFIERAEKDQKSITPMQLLKLVYISHGWHLGLTGSNLIDEDVEAWKYGPVIPSLYRYFKKFGNGSIPRDAIASNVSLSSPDRLNPFLESVWSAYSNYNGIQLSTMTHAEGTPWYEVWHNKGGKYYMGADIPNSMIKSHYLERAANA